MDIEIRPAMPGDADFLAGMVGDLLEEIMAALGSREFQFNHREAIERIEDFLGRQVYFPFLAWAAGSQAPVGVICLYESHALYAEGDFGTIAELYVRPPFRSSGIGALLLEQARIFGKARGWKRLEVTTPPLPLFDKTLAFYERHGFAVTGGRKLKTLL